MGYDPAEVRARREKVREGGGPKRIAAQHARGKLTARERLSLFLDKGSFQEVQGYRTHRFTDPAMKVPEFEGDSVVTGFGKVDGRMVAIYAQDFTVVGGTFSEAQAQKICQIMDLAIEAGVPEWRCTVMQLIVPRGERRGGRGRDYREITWRL